MQITVEATGSRIDPSLVDRIFEAFFTTKALGLGMGLSGCIKNGKSRKSSYRDGPWDLLSVGLSHCRTAVNQRAAKTEIAVWRQNLSWSLQFQTVGSRNPRVQEDAGHRIMKLSRRSFKLGTASSPANLSLIRCGACQNSMRWLSS